VSFALVPLSQRVGSALVAYAAYVGDMLWPARLAVFYPFVLTFLMATGGRRLGDIGGFHPRRALRRTPSYLAVGWFWYLLTDACHRAVQVGAQARADRYTYIPMVGLSIALAWGAPVS